MTAAPAPGDRRDVVDGLRLAAALGLAALGVALIVVTLAAVDARLIWAGLGVLLVGAAFEVSDRGVRLPAVPRRGATGHVEQPRPIPNGSASIQSRVRNDLLAREQLGVERYGTALQPHNGRDGLRDAYEEALDLTCYLRQVIAERDGA
jgi:hypothetical protein